MNWLFRTANKELIKEISRRGWVEEQLKSDGVSIWSQGNNFFFSMGDWAKIDPNVISSAIEHLYSGAIVDWDFEAGPPGGWMQIF